MNSLNVRSEDSIISTQKSTEDNTEASEITDSLMSILDGKFFKIKSKMDKNKVIATCVTREPRHVEIKGSLSSTSNFKSHLKRRHDQSVIDSYLSAKRLKIKDNDNAVSRVHRDKYTQDQFDKDVTNFIIHSMVSLRTVENPFFKKIFENIGITKKINVPSRRNLGRKIHNLFENNKEKIINDIKDIKYVCTTTDVWSSKKRSFLGVTIHWIDVDNFERRSSSLARRRFRGTHSYDRIDDILQDIHLEYNLDSSKIIATITDNGSNFVKAFKAFGVKLTHFVNVEDSVYKNIDLYSDAPVDSQGRDDEQIIYNSAETTEELENSPWLPRHLSCAHTLSLFVATDLIKTIRSPQNSQLNEIHTSVMKKCTLLWNLSYRPKSAEIILQTLGHQLSRPGDTRWNSLYDSLKQILKNKEKNCELFEALGLKNSMLKDSEYIYIDEHLKCVGPLAEALDILQGENNIFYGFVLPVIFSLHRKVQNVLLNDWKYCEPLVNSILTSITQRFSNLVNLNTIKADNAAIAALSHPKFKNRWLSCIDSSHIDRLHKIFNTAVANKIEEINIMLSTDSESTELYTQSYEECHDFFYFDPLVSTGSNAQQSRRSATSEAEIQQYPPIKEIFLCYNTPLPSSAPVERLFSYANMTNLPKSNKLSDDMFEERVILKSNLKMQS
ncbi:hypothetical protein QTP88_027804 [Uroleucon formosanum]